MSEWEFVRLGDHVESCLGKMLDKNKNQGTLHPYLGNKQVRWGRFDLEDLSEMKFQNHEHERYGLKNGDLVVCEGGEPGRCAIWKDEVPGMKIQKALHRIRPDGTLDHRFLYYWFCFAAKFDLLDPYFTGTTIKHLTGRAIAELEVPLPPLPEQKAIAHILGSLDDKIELNRRMNETLEGMAQALFKSWFVDFDPVLDNAIRAGNPIPKNFAKRAETRRKLWENGAPAPVTSSEKDAAGATSLPGLDGPDIPNIGKLFPDSFRESEELGWIPEGWEVAKAEEIVTRHKVKQKFTKKNALDEGPVPIYDQGSGLLLGYSNEPADQDSSKENPKFIFGDHTCITHLSTKPFSVGPNVIPLSAKTYAPYWTFYAIKDLQEFQEYRRHWMEFSIKQVLLPSLKLAEVFNGQIKEFRASMESNVEISKTLTKLRDTLLPKLISGELQIEDAENMLEEAGV